jgi:hypothetical protein
VAALEAAICVKFGREQFPPLKLALILGWIGLMGVGTVACVWASVQWAKRSVPFFLRQNIQNRFFFS